MPTITRITSTGTLFAGSGATFDEITTSTIRVGSTAVFAAEFDEVSLNAGSVNFNGSNQYLSIADNPVFNFGTGNFTIECWSYPTFDVTSGSAAATLWSINGSSYALCCWDNIYKSWNFEIGSGGYTVRPTGGIAANQWTHVAYVRSGTTATVYYNGISVGTATDSYNYAASGGTSLIGYRTTFVQPMIGNISNFRITKGLALYTSNFTPPQNILESTTSTSLLLNVLTSSTFIKDNSSNQLTVTNINTATFSANGPFNQANYAVKQRQLFNGKLEITGEFDEVNAPFGQTTFATTGTGTWTVPAGATSMTIELWGGGGGGTTGNASGDGYGGGGGAYARKTETVTSGTVINFTVGSGGNGATAFPLPVGPATNGTSSTYSTVIAGGGIAGFSGGTATGGDVNISGSAGTVSAGGTAGGPGGGTSGQEPGGGGAGGIYTGGFGEASGSNGRNGRVVISWS